MTCQVELADDLRPEEADDVRGDARLEARPNLFGDRGATQDVAALEDNDLQPGAGKVSGAGQAVMAAADDDRVIFRRPISCQPRPNCIGLATLIASA